MCLPIIYLVEKKVQITNFQKVFLKDYIKINLKNIHLCVLGLKVS